jgi:hypothetical protein
MSLLDLIVVVGSLELFALGAVLLALVRPRRAGPQLALGRLDPDRMPARTSSSPRARIPAPAAGASSPPPAGPIAPPGERVPEAWAPLDSGPAERDLRSG